LPGGGNALPLEAVSCCLLTALLRAGLPPASLKALAKFWLPALEVPDAAEADALGWTASFDGCA
jgi:hypothetical protein